MKGNDPFWNLFCELVAAQRLYAFYAPRVIIAMKSDDPLAVLANEFGCTANPCTASALILLGHAYDPEKSDQWWDKLQKLSLEEGSKRAMYSQSDYAFCIALAGMDAKRWFERTHVTFSHQSCCHQVAVALALANDCHLCTFNRSQRDEYMKIFSSGLAEMLEGHNAESMLIIRSCLGELSELIAAKGGVIPEFDVKNFRDGSSPDLVGWTIQEMAYAAFKQMLSPEMAAVLKIATTM